jgi:hypothetical protein
VHNELPDVAGIIATGTRAEARRSASGALTRWIARTAVNLVLVLTIMGYPLVAGLSEYLDVPNRLLSVPFRMVVLTLSFVAIMAFATRSKKHGVHYFWVVWWTFWVLYLSRMVIDNALNPDALKIPFLEYILYGVGVTLLPAMALSFRGSSALSNRPVWLMILLGVLGVVVNLWIIFFERDLGGILDFMTARAETESLNPISIGHMGVTVVILCLWTYFTRTKRSMWRAVVLIACGLIGLGGLAASGSRGPALALILTLPPLIYAVGRRALGFCILMVLALTIGISQLDLSQFATSELVQRLGAATFDDSVRTSLLTESINSLRDNFLWGGGVEPLSTYPHNVVIESFLMFGLFSGVCFLFLLFYSLWAALRLLTLDPARFWLSLLLLQYTLAAMVSGSLYLVPGMWIFMAAVVSQAISVANLGPEGSFRLPDSRSFDRGTAGS